VMSSGAPNWTSSLCSKRVWSEDDAAERRVYMRRSPLSSAREPGSLGAVSLGVPEGDKKSRAVLALGLLAYTVFDYAARESMRGRPEAKVAVPLGRPRKARALTGAERQRRWREKSKP